MRNYEIMFIIRPTLAEDEVSKVEKSFENILTSNGAKIEQVDDMGQKEFAYEIKKFKSGHYYVITVSSNDDKAIKEFDRVALISNDVVRHLITKIEK
ncbi:MAG: 30S ribosomal protein S6 [Clostridium sp.]|nr:30S ribosomal protein S6 [Clostridium sp.]MCM1443801.1 30S ribosomal protein S6 [Candidatus Amulumruptor caecigallinarius]